MVGLKKIEAFSLIESVLALSVLFAASTIAIFFMGNYTHSKRSENNFKSIMESEKIHCYIISGKGDERGQNLVFHKSYEINRSLNNSEILVLKNRNSTFGSETYYILYK